MEGWLCTSLHTQKRPEKQTKGTRKKKADDAAKEEEKEDSEEDEKKEEDGWITAIYCNYINCICN